MKNMKSKHESILLDACRANQFGRVIKEGNAIIYEAGFIYLDGEPNINLLQRSKEEAKWENRMYICLNGEWEKALLENYPDIIPHTRYQMKQKEIEEALLKQYMKNLPEGYRQIDFNEEVFNKHPFWHGYNYESYKAFQKNGVGSVMMYKDEIVSSSSSYLTYKNIIELDVSTMEAHRNKGLALACCAAVLLECKEKGFKVHWDAQNEASKHMAIKLGYELENEYIAYIIK